MAKTTSARDYTLLKAASWAFLSFWLLWGLDVLAHGLMYGPAGIWQFAWTAAAGTAIGCAAKIPFYAWHEHVWNRWIVGHEISGGHMIHPYVLADEPEALETILAAELDQGISPAEAAGSIWVESAPPPAVSVPDGFMSWEEYCHMVDNGCRWSEERSVL